MAFIPIDEKIAQEESQAKTGLVPIDQKIEQEGGQFFTRAQFPTMVEQGSKSPVSMLERMALSISDDPERELRERFSIVEQLPNGKFAVGNSEQDIRPVDPAGFLLTDLGGDIADVFRDLFVIGGQVLGGLGGTAAGSAVAPGPGTAVGLIGGSAAGAAFAESIIQEVGVMLGVNERTAEERINEALISGGVGGVTGALPIAGKAIAPTVKGLLKPAADLLQPVVNKSTVAFGRMLDRVLNRTPALRERLDKILPAAFSFMGRDARAVKNVLRDPGGAAKVLSPANMNPNHSLLIASRVVRNTTATRNEFGKAVGDALGEAAKKTGGRRVVDASKEYAALTKDLRGLGLLLEGNVVNPHYIGQSADKAVFSNLLAQVGEPRFITKIKLGVPGLPGPRVAGKRQRRAFIRPQQSMTLDEAAIIRVQASNAFDGLSSRGQQIMTRFLRGDNGRGGVANLIANTADEFGAVNFAVANRRFATVADAMHDLKLAGSDSTNLKAMSDLSARFFKADPVTQSAMRRLDDVVPGEIVRNMTNFSSAQNFAQTTGFDVLRTTFLMGLLGVSLGDTAIEKAGVLGTAFLISSSQGQRIMLRRGQAAFDKTTPASIRAAIASANAKMRAAQASAIRKGKALTPVQRRALEATGANVLRGLVTQ